MASRKHVYVRVGFQSYWHLNRNPSNDLALVTDDSVFIASIIFLCTCVYLGSKSPAAGPRLAVLLCVKTYSSVFGEGIMGDERPTSTQNRMKAGTRREREFIY